MQCIIGGHKSENLASNKVTMKMYCCLHVQVHKENFQ